MSARMGRPERRYNMDMQRANRISIQTMETGYEARLFRTHKHIMTINSAETGWVPDVAQNKTLQREMFRVWICDNAATYGITWDPSDQRATTNKRSPKYDSDTILTNDAMTMIQPDIEGFVAGCKLDGLNMDRMEVEDITPMTTSPKGTDLGKLGILDGKYLNGNWAWATIRVVCTFTMPDDVEGYITMDMQLVSGQLKKPTAIDGGGYTQTAFRNAIIKEFGITESKPEADTEIDTEADGDAQ